MTAQQQPAVNAGSELYNMQMNKSQQKSASLFQTPEMQVSNNKFTIFTSSRRSIVVDITIYRRTYLRHRLFHSVHKKRGPT
jgi:hypothetical protein